MVCMQTTHKSIRDLPIKKAKQSRPTREEILEGIGYTPLTFPESLHVPEAVRAAEERANQDYVVAWVQGLWDFIQAHENDPDPSAKLAQDFDESKHPRDERGRFADRGTARLKSKLRSALLFGKVTSKPRGPRSLRPSCWLAPPQYVAFKRFHIPGPPTLLRRARSASGRPS
jgi:hypothetical protein